MASAPKMKSTERSPHTTPTARSLTGTVLAKEKAAVKATRGDA